MNTQQQTLPADRSLATLTALLDRTLGFVVAVIMFVMMLLTFFDVFGRQLFNAPISGSNELTEIAMGMIVYIGLPLVCVRREHITIGLLAGLFRGRLLRWQHVILNLIFAAVSFVWAKQMWVQAQFMAESNAVKMFLQISVAPYVFGMSALTFFSAALFLFLAWCYARGATPKTGGEMA